MCQSRALPSDTEGAEAEAPKPRCHSTTRRGPPKGAHLTRSACWSPPRRWRRWPRWARCCPPRPAEGASGSPRPARWRTSRTCGSTTTRRSATHTHTRTSARRSRPPAKPAPPRHTARALLLGSGSGRALQKRGPWTWKTSITNPRECNPISFKALLFGLRYFVFPTRA